MEMIKIIDLLNLCYKGKQPKKIGYDGDIYECKYFKEFSEKSSEYPICFIYRNVDNNDNFLFRDYAVSLLDEVMIIDETNKKCKDKVLCVETGKVFFSPTEAGKYYGLKNGDAVSKVCRGVRETTKGLHFKYIKDEK